MHATLNKRDEMSPSGTLLNFNITCEEEYSHELSS